jgi:hypothetical protein
MPTATERVVNHVHCDTTDTGPVGCGVLHLVVLIACFYERLLDAAATGNNTDGCTAACIEPFGLTAWHPDTDTALGLVNNNGLHS